MDVTRSIIIAAFPSHVNAITERDFSALFAQISSTLPPWHGRRMHLMAR